MRVPRIPRSLVSAAGALLLISAPAWAEPHRWSLSISPPVTWLVPAGSYRPISAGADFDVGIRMTLAREGIPFALRLEAQSLGAEGEKFEDSLATVHGERVLDPVDASVYNRETYWLAGLEWNPRPDSTWIYAFVGAGGFRLTGTFLGNTVDMVLPDAPLPPQNRVHLCVVGGVGARYTLGRDRRHVIYVETSWLHSGAADWLATPAMRSDLGHTVFPVKRSLIDAWLATFGYSYALRWGGPHTTHPHDGRGWRRWIPKMSE